MEVKLRNPLKPIQYHSVVMYKRPLWCWYTPVSRTAVRRIVVVFPVLGPLSGNIAQLLPFVVSQMAAQRLPGCSGMWWHVVACDNFMWYVRMALAMACGGMWQFHVVCENGMWQAMACDNGMWHILLIIYNILLFRIILRYSCRSHSTMWPKTILIYKIQKFIN